LPYNRDVFAGIDCGPIDCRKSEPFGVHRSLRYRRSEKSVHRLWSKGITRDMSCDGVAFKGNHALPVGSHVELWIGWPVRQAARLIDLHATGFVVWSGSAETGVRFSSYRFRVTGAEFNPTSPRTKTIPAKSPGGR
jgi:hypothetical protein